jgi:hypothetical protein
LKLVPPKNVGTKLLEISASLARRTGALNFAPQEQVSFSILLLLRISLRKPLNAPGRVNVTLFSGKERVAFRADLDADILPGGTGVHDLPAGAGDGRGFVLWV